MRIIRVFPSRNSYTPDDDMVFIGLLPFLLPDHDEVHISCTFSWDKKGRVSEKVEGFSETMEQARNNASEDERSKK